MTYTCVAPALPSLSTYHHGWVQNDEPEGFLVRESMTTVSPCQLLSGAGRSLQMVVPRQKLPLTASEEEKLLHCLA